MLPSSTSELAAAVAGVVAAAGANPLSIRATSSVFHSTSPFTCPYGYGGGLGSPLPFNYGPLPGPPVTSAAVPATAAVLLDSLRGVSTPLILGNNSNDLRMTVLAGSRLWQVWEWAAERGLSPPRGVPTVWSGEKTRRGKEGREKSERKKKLLSLSSSHLSSTSTFSSKKKTPPKKDLSVGGIVSASSHGSGGVGRPSAFNDMVVEYVWVDATGELSFLKAFSKALFYFDGNESRVFFSFTFVLHHFFTPFSLLSLSLPFPLFHSSGTIHRSPHDSDEGRAIAGGMGLLGIVTEVTLKMEPLSKTAALTLTAKSDNEMARDTAAL